MYPVIKHAAKLGGLCLTCGLMASVRSEASEAMEAGMATPSAPTLWVMPGMDFTSGNYGLDSTSRIETFDLSLSCEWERLDLRADLPWLHTETPAGTVLVDGRPRFSSSLRKRLLANKSKSSQSESGLGDASLGATWQAWRDQPRGLEFKVDSDVKFATGDDQRGLGTGTTDFDLGCSLSKTTGAVTCALGGLYHWYGDATSVPLKDGLELYVDLSYELSPSWRLKGNLDRTEACVEDSPADSELTVGFEHDFSKGMMLELHALAGFSQASPDYGVGGSLHFSF